MKQPSQELIRKVSSEIVRVSQDLQHYAEEYAEHHLDVRSGEFNIDQMIIDIEKRAQAAAEHIIREVRLEERKLRREGSEAN